MEYSDFHIEKLLLPFKPVIGKDFDRYRNHVYRVFLNCLLMDSEKSNEEKYAIAAVFHDIGIWTNCTIDYLNPSIEQATMYLTQTGKQHWIDEITRMIYWHHKISSYPDKHNKMVENFRKADWIDVSFGLLNFGLDTKKIREVKQSFPNLGFHLFLIRKIVKNFFIHPLQPFPMFKR